MMPLLPLTPELSELHRTHAQRGVSRCGAPQAERADIETAAPHVNVNVNVT